MAHQQCVIDIIGSASEELAGVYNACTGGWPLEVHDPEANDGGDNRRHHIGWGRRRGRDVNAAGHCSRRGFKPQHLGGGERGRETPGADHQPRRRALATTASFPAANGLGRRRGGPRKFAR